MAKHNLHFKTLTPISVTTGEKFSPYSDFVLENDSVHFIDKEKLKQILQSRPNIDALLDSYVAGVATGMDNNRSHFELKNYLTGTLKATLQELTLRKHPKTNSVTGKIYISEIIKSPRFEPYVPGSSLKGACKTALLYDWLKNSGKGKQWLEKFISHLDTYKDRKKAQELENELQNQMQKFELAFADSSLLSPESICIHKIVRFHIQNPNSKGTPQYIEAIDRENIFTAEFRSESLTPEKLFQALAQFSQDANQRDLELIDKIEHSNETIDEIFFNYKDLQEKLQNGEICFKIGSGKGYFFNSVGLAVYHQDKNKFREFLQVFRPAKRAVKDANLFPLTKVISADTQEPWGWVQVDTKSIPKTPKIVSIEIGLPFEFHSESQDTKEEIKHEIRAEYLSTGTKLKKGTTLDAVVVQSGKPNKVKLMIAEGNEPVFELRGYNSEIPDGKIIICQVSQINAKGQILDVSFVKFK
jgi:CRISPR-associated protein Csm5